MQKIRSSTFSLLQICCVFAEMSTGEIESKGLDQTRLISAEISSDCEGLYIRLHNLEDNLVMK